MDLTQLLHYDEISIQCHNNPDADTIASGFALYRYFHDAGKRPRLFYSGRAKASKPNIIKMIEGLGIPLEYLPTPPEVTGLLVLVDCQYGEKNVSAPPARDICVIDHHLETTEPTLYYDVRPSLAACSSLVWSLLTEAGYAPDKRVRSALNYGLYMDSQGFEELGHPLDRDVRDLPDLDDELLKVLKNSNLSLDDLQLAAASLNAFSYCPKGRYMLVAAPQCDPNILGFMSDLAMQVDQVERVVAYSSGPDGVKLSIRSLSRESKASDMAEHISRGIGSGGGHAGKAGGRLDWSKVREAHGDTPIHDLINKRLSSFLSDHALLDCADLGAAREQLAARGRTDYADFSLLREYEKQPEHLAFVDCMRFFPAGTRLQVRMLEGDIAFSLADDTCLMIGGAGEVYPIKREAFARRYSPDDRPVNLNLAYDPVVLDTGSGERLSLISLAQSCLSRAGIRVRATPLLKGVRMFTVWDRQNYVKGNPGDWLVVGRDKPDDWYIVTRKRFPQIYAPVESSE